VAHSRAAVPSCSRLFVFVSRSGASPRLVVWFVFPVLTGGCLVLMLAEVRIVEPLSPAARILLAVVAHSRAAVPSCSRLFVFVSRSGASPRVVVWFVFPVLTGGCLVLMLAEVRKHSGRN
jgi:fructoselysine-6-P-deglycase FrlB-like protein